MIIKDGKEFFATSLLDWKPKQVKKTYRKRWVIEECIKLRQSEFALETCQARTVEPIRAHAYICLMSFNELELFRTKHDLSTLYHIRSVLFNEPIPLQTAWQLKPELFA